MPMERIITRGLSTASLILASGLVWAAGQYGPGASDTEIKIGNTMPYSGPASAYGIVGKSEAAYFALVNEHGVLIAVRSTLSAAMTATARRKPLSKCVDWSSKTRCCFCSARSARRPMPQFTAT
jgi:hypothetical protein